VTNPYLRGSDYDSMAGVSPYKTSIANRIQRALPARAVAAARPMMQPAGPAMHPVYAHPAQHPAQYSPAEMFEMARGDESPIGMDSGTVLIPAGASATVFTSPQKPCIPSRMVLTDAIANTFIMLSLTVGVEPIFLTNGVAVSLAAFTPQSTVAEFRSVLCHVGNSISATITNIGGASARFVATIYATPWLFGSGLFEG